MNKLVACFAVCLFACHGTIVGSGGGDDNAPDAGSDNPAVDGSVISDPDAPLPQLAIASGIRIRDISVYQGVQIPVVADGVRVDEPRPAHVIAGKPGMIGVFVDVEDGWQNRQIIAELDIETSAGVLKRYTSTQTIDGASGSDPFSSGFAFVVNGADFTAEGRYAVTLRETTSDAEYPGESDGARWPLAAGELDAFEPWEMHGILNLVLVPFAYNADGSGRVPPIDEAALQQYRDLFGRMYPVAEINLSVRETVPYNSSLIGGGWSAWLDRLTQIREQDNPPANTYYYGVASPRASFGAYCNGGCIVGLGWVPGRDDEYGRASVGVSFAGDVNVFTAAHEVGHNMGRNHAPCGGPSGVDGSYPYSGAAIGVWGYDSTTQELKQPSEHKDVMSYCNNQWISDYTYDGITHRLSHVNQTVASAVATPRRYRVGLVDGAGKVTWRRYTTIRSRVGGQQMMFNQRRADGSSMGTVAARFYRYDHLDGGMLLVPVDSGRVPAKIVSPLTGAVTW